MKVDRAEAPSDEGALASGGLLPAATGAGAAAWGDVVGGCAGELPGEPLPARAAWGEEGGPQAGPEPPPGPGPDGGVPLAAGGHPRSGRGHRGIGPGEPPFRPSRCADMPTIELRLW